MELFVHYKESKSHVEAIFIETAGFWESAERRKADFRRGSAVAESDSGQPIRPASRNGTGYPLEAADG